MSTCPEKDIHSLYLDNELPANFAKQYEQHIASCPKCKAELDSMRALHDALKADADSLKLDQVFLDQSFERLQSRLRYSKVVSKSKDNKPLLFPIVKKYAPAAAAAAFVFALMLPFSMRTNASSQGAQNASMVSQIQTIKRTTDFTIDQNSLMTEKSTVNYPINLVSQKEAGASDNTTFSLDSFNPLLHNAATPVSQYRGRAQNQRSSKLLADDFFMPDFVQERDQMTLQIYMPSYVDISALNK